MQVSEQAQRSVSDVFVLAKHCHCWAWKKIRDDSLTGLNAGLFVNADSVNTFGLEEINRAVTVLGVFTSLLEHGGMLLGSHRGLASRSLEIGQQLYNFLFEHVRFFTAFDTDEPLPVVSPTSPPYADGIMLQPDRLLNRLVVVPLEEGQDDSTTLSERNLGRLGSGKPFQNISFCLFHRNLLNTWTNCQIELSVWDRPNVVADGKGNQWRCGASFASRLQ